MTLNISFTIMKTIVKETPTNIMYHHTGMTTRPGCQCYGDCGCHDNWVSQPYSYYTVKRIGKKTTIHQTLEEAEVRWDFICSLNN